MDGRKKRVLLEQLHVAHEHTKNGGITEAIDIINRVVEEIIAELGPTAHAEAVASQCWCGQPVLNGATYCRQHIPAQPPGGHDPSDPRRT